MESILYAILITTGLTAVLAVVLLLAERWLVNTGPCEIDINQGQKTFEIPGGESLLTSLKEGGVFLASACGGRGTCAYCKCNVLTGGGPVGPTEESLLTPDEIEAGVRIACQVKVREPITIQLPDAMLSVQSFRGTLVEKTPLTHDIVSLRIQLLDPEAMDYVPGQYVQLEVPAYPGSSAPASRAYSISSTPSDEGFLELIVRLVPGGISTTWVFDHLRVGDELTLTGPHGEFQMTDTDSPMIWIAGGSGLAPFWSMVRHAKEIGLSRPTTFFFGAVTETDLFFVEELRQLADELDWFTYCPALSGQDLGDWAGETGLITDAVKRNTDPDTLGPQQTEAYLCGSPGMCDAACKTLVAQGIDEERIYFDKFA